VGVQYTSGDQLSVVKSSLDGLFDLTFWSPAGRTVYFTASSENPWAMAAGKMLQLTPDVERDSIDIVLQTRAVSVHLKDAGDDHPIAGCMVSVAWGTGAKESKAAATPASAGASGRISDKEGVVVLPVMEKGTARVRPSCNGYASGEGVEVQVGADETREVTIRLDRTDLILLRVNSGSGPAAGARVLAQPLESQSATDARAYWATPELLGETGADGELGIRGDIYGGRAIFVVAPGSALSLSRLPSGKACDANPEACRVDVALSPPMVFPGVRLLSASGKALPAQWLVFSRDGIAVSAPVVEETYHANGLPVGSGTAGGGGLSTFPSLLEPGSYAVSFISFTKSHTPRATPVGFITVPSGTEVALRAMKLP